VAEGASPMWPVPDPGRSGQPAIRYDANR